MEAKRVCGEDRIPELPLHIIRQDAAQTCVLSERWYNFWTSRPNLVLKDFAKCDDRRLEDFVKYVEKKLLEFVFESDTMPFNDVPHFVQKLDYSKGLILVHKSKVILIYEDREIVIPSNDDEVRLLIRPILHLESFIEYLMDMYPRSMSILPSTNS